MLWAMMVCMSSSEQNEGEPLASATAASKYLSQVQGREEQDLTQTSKIPIKR